MERLVKKSLKGSTFLGDESICDDIAKSVIVAGRRGFWRISYSRQALTLRYFRAKRGIECSVRIDVKRNLGEALGSHPWVERNGYALIGGEHAQSLCLALI